jgi:ankyrin repeat protein
MTLNKIKSFGLLISLALLTSCASPQQQSTPAPARTATTSDSKAIFFAAGRGDLEMVRTLLQRSPQLISAKDPVFGTLTLLGVAASGNHKDVVEFLLSKGAVIDARDGIGSTALASAAIQGNKDVVELLLASGADVNARANDGQTPLHNAAVEGRKSVAELLLAKGADVNAKDKDGQTPLHIAMNRGFSDVAELLRQHGGQDFSSRASRILEASVKGDLETVKALIKEDPDLVRSTNNDGYTPLHWAAIRGFKELTAFLLDHGADIRAKEQFGDTPLYSAAFAGRTEIVELLLNKGADPTTKDKNGQTALQAATTQRHQDVAQLLRKRMGLPENSAGIKMLEAAKSGDLEQVKALLKEDPTLVGTKDDTYFGATPLHLAAGFGHKDIVELLLANKAKVNAKNNNGYTPLFMAARSGRRDIVESLLANKADVNAKGTEGLTPLQAALRAGHNDVVDLLREHGGQ